MSIIFITACYCIGYRFNKLSANILTFFFNPIGEAKPTLAPVTSFTVSSSASSISSPPNAFESFVSLISKSPLITTNIISSSSVL